jgi:hypothetical protein
MGVVIHEFEIVDSGKGEPRAPEARPGGQAEARHPPPPREVGRAIRQLADRLARVSAH